MAAPTLFAQAKGASSSTPTTSHSITLPTHAAGDRLLVFLTATGNSAHSAVEAGWTEVLSATTGSVLRHTAFTKIAAGGSETLTVTTASAAKSSHTSNNARPSSGMTTAIDFSPSPGQGFSDGTFSGGFSPTGGLQDYLTFNSVGSSGNTEFTSINYGGSNLYSQAGVDSTSASTATMNGNETTTAVSDASFGGNAIDVNWMCFEIAIWEVPDTGPTQVARPDADITDGSWTPSTGSDLYAAIDETTQSDADYISTAANSECEIGLGTLPTPGSGAQTFSYTAAGSAAKALVASIYRGATLHQQWTIDPLPLAVTRYDRVLSTGITDTSDLRIRFETVNAASPPTTQVTYGAIGTTGSTTATTSVTAAYPSGISAATSKLYLVVTGRSNTASTSAAITGGGWTLVGSLEDGVGTWGVDTGTRRVEIWKKDTVTGTESGNVTVTLAGTANNTLYARIVRVEVPSGYGISEQFVSGADTSAGTGLSATASSSATLATNSLLLIAHAGSTDTSTQSSQSITASGITFGTRTNRASIAVTGGNDHRHVIDTVPVTTGSGTAAAPTYAYTGSASTSGPVGFLVLTAVAPTEYARVTWAEFRTPEGDGGAAVTATFSAALAVQAARSAAAALGLAVQAPRTSSTSTALAIRAARSAGSSLSAAVRQARSASSLVQAAVQAPHVASTSVSAALQLVRSAAADLDLVVQQVGALSTDVSLQVQAPAEATLDIDMMIQVGASASASIAVAVQALRQATTALAIVVSEEKTNSLGLDTAVQHARMVSADVSLQIQSDAEKVVSIQLAVQFASSAAAAIAAAIQEARAASLGLAAAIRVENVLGIAIDAATQRLVSEGFGVSLYVRMGSGLYRWNGSSWVTADLRRWNGASFVAADLGRWDGTDWVEV